MPRQATAAAIRHERCSADHETNPSPNFYVIPAVRSSRDQPDHLVTTANGHPQIAQNRQITAACGQRSGASGICEICGPPPTRTPWQPAASAVRLQRCPADDETNPSPDFCVIPALGSSRDRPDHLVTTANSHPQNPQITAACGQCNGAGRICEICGPPPPHAAASTPHRGSNHPRPHRRVGSMRGTVGGEDDRHRPTLPSAAEPAERQGDHPEPGDASHRCTHPEGRVPRPVDRAGGMRRPEESVE
jgi:hypothetical protein